MPTTEMMNSVHNPRMLLAGLVVLLVGCGGTGVSAGPTTTIPSAQPAVQSATTTNAPQDESTRTVVSDYAAFVASVDDALAGTFYEETVLENVEVYVVTAELLCDLLDEGMTADEVLTAYLDRLAEERVVDLDDGTMAGVVLGAAVEVVCPEHAEGISRLVEG